MEMIKSDAPSSRQLINSLNLQVSLTTVLICLNDSGWRYVKALKAPALTEVHKICRNALAKSFLVEMCQQHKDYKK